MSSSQRSVELLLIEFLQILSHEIRSPLSVLSNEVELLLHTQKNGDALSMQRAVSQITTIINSVSHYPVAAEQNESEISAKEIKLIFEGRVSIAFQENEDHFNLRTEFKPLLFALRDISRLSVDSAALNFNQHEQTLSFRAKFSAENSDKKSALFNLYPFSLNSSTSPVTILLAELILRLAGSEISLQSNELTIIVPYGEKLHFTS